MPFQPGQSGNPAGRAKENGEVKALARKYTVEAFETLAEVMADTKAPPSARVAAANSMLDRGWGRPVQEVTGEGGTPLFAGPLTVNLVRVAKG